MKKEKNIWLIVSIALLLLVGYLLFDKISNKNVQIDSLAIEDLSEEEAGEMTREFVQNWESNREEVPKQEELKKDYPLLMKCNTNKEFKLNFVQVSNSPGPGEIPVPIESTLAEVLLDTKEEFYLALDENVSSGIYTFSNFRYKDQEKVVILQIKSNVAELALSSGEKYENCKNEKLELIREKMNNISF